MSISERVVGEAAEARVRDAIGPMAASIEENHGDVSVYCTRDELVRVTTALRDRDGLRCRYFCFLSAVDYSEFPVEEGEQKRELELLVRVYSPEFGTAVTVHVPLSFADPVCPSITEVYSGAIWHERECHEMFGIDFPGHPRLVGLYLPEDFEGHPGLRSFKLPTRTLVKEWPGAKDPDEAAAGGR